MFHCHYRSYQLTFPSAPDIMSVFGNLKFSMMKKIANRLGFSLLSEMYSAFTEKGLYAKIPENDIVYDISINRKSGLEAIREMNGNITKYRMGATYDNHISNQYHSYRSKSELTFSYVMRKLPDGVTMDRMLMQIEKSAERSRGNFMKRSCYSEGYIYDGIPNEVIILTWIMMLSTGKNSGISRSYIMNIFEMDYANPRTKTLKIFADAWGMSLSSFIKAIEQDDLVLGPEECEYGRNDNTKMGILSRIMCLTEHRTWHDFARSFPEEKKTTVRNLIHSPEADIEIYTILALIKPFPDIKLSDLFI